MHVCFRGGTGDSRVSRSISVIRGFTKNMKAMSLKAKEGGGGGHGRRRRRKEADGGDHKDGSRAASAKIAPAQLQEDETYDGNDHRRDQEVRSEEDKKGGKKQEYCDKCCSPLLDDDGDGADEKKDSVREWVAEPGAGVLLTLSPRPDGSNCLRRVRFREELFDAWAAQSWWADNHDRIVELYSVVQSDDDGDDDDAAAAMPATPCQSDEEEAPQDATTPRAESWSPSTSNFSGEPSCGSGSAGTVGSPILGLVTDNRSGSKTPPRRAPRAAAAQQDDDEGEEEEGVDDQQWREWVEEYEPGVFLTVRAYPDHPLQLRHVELSRERFGEVKAKVWWEENKDKLRSLYSF
ncbi:hypothetical protein ACQ4PT_048113 [Festuca glaucescens]